MKKIEPGLANSNKNLVMYIQGGLGKVIMATAVIKSYKLANPSAKIVTVSGYPEVFINNPDVHRFYAFATPYLWQDFYGNPEWNVFAQDPYFEEEWIKNQHIHLIDIWADMLGVPSVQKEPLLYFSGPEIDDINAMIQTDKPLVCVQSTGGTTPASRSWTRNPPAHELDAFLAQYKDTHFVAHICLPETPVLNNVHQRIEKLTRRQAMCLMHYSGTVVGIDSYSLHCRIANPDRGESIFFFPISENVVRLGYKGTNLKIITPRQEVDEIIRKHADYFSFILKLGIENSSDNCPIPPSMKWFEV